MANQQNYPEKLESFNQVRPNRITDKDFALITKGTKPVIFGQTHRDVIEIYLYDDGGNITGHINLRPTDPEVTLTNRVTEVEQTTYLNVDLASALKRANVLPGRYAMTINTFRDEVGSEEGYKLYIAQISTSRTELRLLPVDVDDISTKGIFEFTEPSVSPEFAQALIDQVFGVSLSSTPNNTITADKVLARLDADTLDRINYSQTKDTLIALINSLVPNIRTRVLDLMANNVDDIQIQDSELQQFIADGTDQILLETINSGQVDSRFQLI